MSRIDYKYIDSLHWDHTTFMRTATMAEHSNVQFTHSLYGFLQYGSGIYELSGIDYNYMKSVHWDHTTFMGTAKMIEDSNVQFMHFYIEQRGNITQNNTLRV